MKKREKVELGRLLDRHQVKSLYYEEESRKGGVYHLICRTQKGNLNEKEIYGADLD